MGSARTVTTTDLLTIANYELRNTHQKQFTAAELTAYINEWLEFIHELLCEEGSDIVRTGTGTISTVAGQEQYDLSLNSMGDLWFPHAIWVSGYEPMEMCSESDRYEYVNADENGDDNDSIPEKFYIEGDNIGLLPFPDAVYTVKFKYYPNFVPIGTGDTIPFKNLFNLQIKQGVKILAKNRESYGSSVDAALMEIFKDRALFIIQKRQKNEAVMSMSDEWIGRE